MAQPVRAEVVGGELVFELSPAGNGWAFTLPYSFSGEQGMHCGPRAVSHAWTIPGIYTGLHFAMAAMVWEMFLS